MARKPGDKEGGDDLFDKLFGEEEGKSDAAPPDGGAKDIDLDALDREVGIAEEDDDDEELEDPDLENALVEEVDEDEFEEASDDDFLFAEEGDIEMVGGAELEKTDPQRQRERAAAARAGLEDEDDIQDDLLGDDAFTDPEMAALAEGRLHEEDDESLEVDFTDDATGFEEEADDEEIFGDLDDGAPPAPVAAPVPPPVAPEPAPEVGSTQPLDQLFGDEEAGPSEPADQDDVGFGAREVGRPRPALEEAPLFGAPDPDPGPTVDDEPLFGAPDPDAVPSPSEESSGLVGNVEGYENFHGGGGRGVAPVRGGGSERPAAGAAPAAGVGEDEAPIADEATQIIDLRDARSKAEVPRLVVHTRDRGDIEYRVEDDGLTIGRGVDNDVVISDIAASRQHAIIQVRDGRYFLADLGSGNGTRVAGRKITEVALKGGEEVEIGTVHCHFVVPSKAGTVSGVKSARAEGGTSRLGKVLLVIALVLLLAVIAGVVVKYVLPKGTAGGGKTNGGAGGAGLTAGASQGTAKKFFDQGVEKFKQRAWKDALNKFQVVAQLDAHFPNIDSYVKRCREEEENERFSEEGNAAYREKRYEEAYSSLKKVSEESVYRTDAQALMMRVEDALVASKLRRARDSLRRDPAKALELSKEVLEIAPTNTAAFDLRTQAEDALAGGGDRVAAAENPPPRHRERSRPRKRRTPRRSRERVSVPPPEREEATPPPAAGEIKDGLALFDQKRFGEAASFFERLIGSARSKRTRKNAAKLARSVKTFKAAWDGGTSHLKKRAFKPAIREFEKALKLSKGIKRNSPVTDEIKQRRLAPAYVLHGNNSLKNTKYSEAYSSFKKALQHKPDYAPARKGLNKLGAQAKKLYYEGYVAKYSDPDTARKKWRIVIQITPPDNEWHQKAKKRLEE